MFKPCPPWLMFNGTDASGGNADRATLSPEDFLTRFGFPKDTPLDDMSVEQKAAYWRDKSKGFQKDAENAQRDLQKWSALGEFDTVSRTVSDVEAERQRNLSDAERAQEAARQAQAAALSSAEATARQKYLPTAIEAQIVAQTIKPGEKLEDATKRVQSAMQFVDVNRFVTTDGEIDAGLIQTFAQSIAPADAGGNPRGGGDPLAGLMGRQSLPAPGAAGSVAEARRQTRERLTTKK